MIYIENTGVGSNLVSKNGYVLVSFSTMKMAEDCLKELISDLFFNFYPFLQYGVS